MVLETEQMRCIGMTNNLEEAHALAERYSIEGYDTKIIEKRQGGVMVFEIWVGKKPEGFEI